MEKAEQRDSAGSEAKANLTGAFKLALQYHRELAGKGLSPHAVREVFEIAEA